MPLPVEVLVSVQNGCPILILRGLKGEGGFALRSFKDLWGYVYYSIFIISVMITMLLTHLDFQPEDKKSH